MTIRIPYLRAEQLSAKMTRRPQVPFFLRSSDYAVIDGDTLRVMAPKMPDDKGRPEAFSIRFRSVAAPEKPVRQMTDAIFRSAGIEPWAENPGILSKTALKSLLKGHALLIEPRGADRHGRLLADIAVSGSAGRDFDLNGARSVEHVMLLRKMVAPFRGDVPLPPVVPELLLRLREQMTGADPALPSP